MCSRIYVFYLVDVAYLTDLTGGGGGGGGGGAGSKSQIWFVKTDAVLLKWLIHQKLIVCS